MKLPPKIKYPRELIINDEVYKVRFVKKVDKGSSTVGYCDPSERVIKIKENQVASELLGTFIHECLHAMEFEYGIKISHKLVYQLDRAITDFLLQNF